jgi:hypothetical protein
MTQVGPGVKELSEGDVVLPTVPLLGTFTQAAVVKAKQLVRVGKLAAMDNNTAAATEQPQGARMDPTHPSFKPVAATVHSHSQSHQHRPVCRLPAGCT